jgi:hypothetical protein
MIASGQCTILADQAGDINYNAAAQVSRSFLVIGASGVISASPAALSFGSQTMQTTSAPQTVVLTNMSGTPLTISSVVISSYFTLSHNCGALAIGASCSATVTFVPTAQGDLFGTLSVLSSAGGAAVSLSGTGERSLVSFFYQSILRRAPDAAGKSFWDSEAARMQALGVNVNETWYAMATSFFSSAEYLSFNRDDTGFVTDLYTTFFNRAPDAAGLAFWSGQLAAGMPREVALVSFMFSPEFVAFTQGIFGTTVTRAEMDMVGDFYRGILARLPDDAGFNFWVAQFRAAQCRGAQAVSAQAEAISSQFATGSEYLARGRTNAQYVGDLYNAFLRRGGDLAGVQFWINQVATGAMTREKVRQQFVASPEFQARVSGVLGAGCLQ